MILRERFAFPMPYSDPHGKLELSSKQKQKIKRWARPDEFIAEPKMLQIGILNRYIYLRMSVTQRYLRLMPINSFLYDLIYGRPQNPKTKKQIGSPLMK